MANNIYNIYIIKRENKYHSEFKKSIKLCEL